MKSYTFDKTHLKLLYNSNKYKTIYFKNLFNDLKLCKTEIDKYNKLWEKYKKSVNDYEYIYTKYDMYKNICNILPISRSYFKLHEIIYDFNITNIKKVACIAEGPGGFIQLLNSKFNKIEQIYGITLISENKNIPSWNIKIKKNDKIKLLFGKDKTGDICNLDNINDMINTIGRNSCDLITCDGGIDYSENFINQELDSYDFIYNEILFSLQIQKNGGNLIIKMFDLLHINTIQLLYLLYQCYDTITINKPYTSRNTNSEKYIICQNYKYNIEVIDLLLNNYDNKNIKIHIPKSFLENIKFYNYIFVENQIKKINIVLDKIKSNIFYIDKPSDYQKKVAIEWCKTYNLDINPKCIYLNTL